MEYLFLRENDFIWGKVDLMKILDVYDKNSDLKFNGRNVFDVMNKFFLRFPKGLSDNYYRKLDTVKIFRVDELYEKDYVGKYDELGNCVFFSNFDSIGHELMHMASYNDMAFGFANSLGDFSNGLIEGMNEYMTMLAFDQTEIVTYCFEVFCAMMLTTNFDFEKIYKPFFIPNHSEFISLFSNKNEIYSLMYSLGYYYEFSDEYFNKSLRKKERREIIEKIKIAIMDTINSLINIELSKDLDFDSLTLYCEKFLDLMNSMHVKKDLEIFFPGCVDYADTQIKTRIRSKR